MITLKYEANLNDMAARKKSTTKKGKLIQVSKEYWRGKWQKVGFYREGKRIVIRPIKESDPNHRSRR
jgi:hypothetical protein